MLGLMSSSHLTIRHLGSEARRRHDRGLQPPVPEPGLDPSQVADDLGMHQSLTVCTDITQKVLEVCNAVRGADIEKQAILRVVASDPERSR